MLMICVFRGMASFRGAPTVGPPAQLSPCPAHMGEVWEMRLLRAAASTERALTQMNKTSKITI